MRLTTIAERFDPRDNAITPLRLLLALAVVFSHTFPAAGWGFDPLMTATGEMQIGSVAVVMFFGLSGFLLVGTRTRRGRTEFAWHRFLRIAPALAVCLILTVAVVVPIAAAMTHQLPDWLAVGNWVGAILTLHVYMPDVPNVFGGRVQDSLLNASIWTLPVEIWCYIVLGIVAVRFVCPTLVLVTGLAIGLNAAAGGQAFVLHMPIAFCLGGLMALGSDRIPLDGRIAAVLVASTALAAAVGALSFAVPLTLPYVAIWLGVALPLRWRRDLSYGTYIYAWPIQELLVLAGLAAFGLVALLAGEVIVILGIAAISSVLVEEPALRLRKARLAIRSRVRATAP